MRLRTTTAAAAAASAATRTEKKQFETWNVFVLFSIRRLSRSNRFVFGLCRVEQGTGGQPTKQVGMSSKNKKEEDGEREKNKRASAKHFESSENSSKGKRLQQYSKAAEEQLKIRKKGRRTKEEAMREDGRETG